MYSNERLNGTWQTTDLDKKLQSRFWALFPKSKLHGQVLFHIGADFLRNNKFLLD